MSLKIEDGKNAKSRYNDKAIKTFKVTCHVLNDKDIIDLLETADNKSSFLKEIIRSYIKNK